MAEPELSKRIDDLHRRMDDMGRHFSDLNATLAVRFAATDKRLDDLRGEMVGRLGDMHESSTARLDALNESFTARLGDMNLRFDDMNRKLTTFMWVVSGWFTFLTAMLAVFGFLRL
jgi:hypothetical protein